jgi:NADPH:quinone reductase-like Zn-dependent oxidoreductase
MAIEAARRRAEARETSFSQFEFREVTVGAALVLTDDVDTETTISLKPYAEGTRGNSDTWDEFRISSWTSKRGWTVHCSGIVRTHANKKGQTSVSNAAEVEQKHFSNQIDRIMEQATYEIDTQNMYQVLTDIGAGYGPSFQGLENIFSHPQHSRGDLYVRDTKALMPKNFEAPLTAHPTFLDALLHLTWPILGQGRMELGTLYMPTMIKSLIISDKIPSAPGESVKAWCNGGPSLANPEPVKFDLWVMPETSTEILINMEGLTMTPLRDEGAVRGQKIRDLCYKFEWKSLVELEEVAAESQEPNDHVNGNGINGHASQPNGVLTNGRAGSGLTNGHINGNLSPDLKPHINGNGILHDHPLTDVVITQFGKSDSIADELRDAIQETSDWKPSISSFEDVDATGKHVIVLQTGVPSLRNLTAEGFESIKKNLLNASNILWVYRLDTPDAQMIVGLTRSLRSETMAKAATLGLETEDLENPVIPIMASIDSLWSTNTLKPCNDFEFRAKGAELFVPRALTNGAADAFVHNETHEMTISSQPFQQPGRRIKLQIGNPGALDTLYFADDVVEPLADDDIEIEVKATGLNFKDIVVTMGQLAQPYIGIECSGIVSSVGKNVQHLKVGQRVMALPLGGYSTFARCKASSAAPLPANMSFEVGATVPVVFCTAYYALFDLGHLQEGERILIHAGAGGVGQAAIMLAQMIGAEIFVTVGSLEKKQFLMTEYGIPEDHILYSRDTSFSRGIRRATNNQGVDVVVNSLAGDLLRETWECLAPFGRFVEIGKADITKNTRLDMLPFEYNISFASVDLTKVAAHRPKLMKRLLDNVTELMAKQSVHPILPLTTYQISELETAFRTLQTGKAMGKIVVVPHQDDYVNVSKC